MAEPSVRDDVIPSKRRLEALGRRSVKLASMLGPGLLPDCADARGFLIGGETRDPTERVQLGRQADLLRGQALDLAGMVIDPLLCLGGRQRPALNLPDIGRRQVDELIDIAVPGPQFAQAIRQRQAGGITRPFGQPAARRVVVRPRGRNGRRER